VRYRASQVNASRQANWGQATKRYATLRCAALHFATCTRRPLFVATLGATGTRFLDGYSDDETQYADLMSNAVTYARAHNLRPGVSLSDEQMAALTSDIVWLVEKEVTLPNGSKVTALVPQLYTKLRSGDLAESGALLGGANVQMNLTGDVNNYGTIAGRNIVSLSANNINNMNSVSGNLVSLDASRDINVIGGQVQASSALYANAGRNINVASTGTASDQTKGFTYQGIDRVAGLYVSGNNGTLAMSAGGNINLTAANIINSGLNSTTSLSAKGNINLATLTQGSSNSVVVEAGKQFLKDGQTSEVGTSIIGGGNVSLSGTNVNLRAATIQAGIASNATNGGTGALGITALNTINVTAGVATQTYAFADKAKVGGGGLFGSDGETVTIKTTNNTFAQGSNLGGNTVALQAGSFTGNGTQSTAGAALGNINVVGSNTLSTSGTNLIATGNVSVTNAVNTFNSTFYQQTTESGFLSGGTGLSVTYGDRTQRQTQNQSWTTAAASTIGATNGSVNTLAGGRALITGSNLVAGSLNATSNKIEGGGDINIQGSNVTIKEAREASTGQSTTFFEQSGITVGVSIGALNAVQSAAQMSSAMRTPPIRA
jgi:filamentous hemagglutinin